MELRNMFETGIWGSRKYGRSYERMFDKKLIYAWRMTDHTLSVFKQTAALQIDFVLSTEHPLRRTWANFRHYVVLKIKSNAHNCLLQVTINAYKHLPNCLWALLQLSMMQKEPRCIVSGGSTWRTSARWRYMRGRCRIEKFNKILSNTNQLYNTVEDKWWVPYPSQIQ